MHVSFRRCSLLILFFLCSATIAHAYSFSRNLGVGSSGEDVRQLQILLNKDPNAEITSFFGPRTQAAVMAFQNKYGISATGFFGPITRAKINTIFSNSTPASPPAPPLTMGGEKYPETLNLRLYQALPYQVSPGGTVTLVGDNMLLPATLHIGDNYSAPVSLAQGKYQAVIPTNVPENSYQIWVTNATGSSKSPTFSVNVMVTRTPKSPAHVAAVSPQTLSSLSGTVTVSGSGFSGTFSVVSIYGTISNLSSADSSTFTFSPSQFSNAAMLQKVYSNRPAKSMLPISFYVVTDAGVSDTSGSFVVQ